MKPIFVLSLSLIIGSTVIAQPNILFVGNSFTHGHENPVITYNRSAVTDANGTGQGGVPAVFKKLADQAGYECDVTIEAVSGQTLAYHLANQSAVIGAAKWDVVVLQENSTRPLPTANGGNPNSFIQAGDGLQELILSFNPSARIILYETWASPTSAASNGYAGDLQAMQDDLTEAYYRLRYRSVRTAGKPDFPDVARVGDAFMHAVDAGLADPDLSDGLDPDKFYLWSTGDNRHAGKYGSYLSAVMFFAKITGRDPRDIPTGTGTAASDLGISPTRAEQIHQVVHDTLAMSEPAAPAPQPSVVNTLTAGTSPYNWNNTANWSAGPISTTHSLLVTASSPANSIVANSTQGSPTTSVRNVSFDTGAATKNVQGNATVTTTRILNLTGGSDALGGVSLLHLSAGTTGTINFGTNSGLGKLVVTPASAGAIRVDNASGTLLFGPASELSGAVNLTKEGAGRLVLGGANSFGSGPGNALTINAGTVLANTPVSGANSATGSADVAVRAGAILGGTGQIAPGSGHRVVVDADGVISPGDGVGTLTLNGANTTANLLTLSTGACLRIELDADGTGGALADKLVVLNAASGDAQLSGAVVDFTDHTGGRLPPGNLVIMSTGNATAYAGLTLDTDGFITGGLSIGSGLDAYDAKLRLVNGDIVVVLADKPYVAWTKTHFTPTEQQDPMISGDLATPTGDGVPNLLKYAFNLDPRTAIARVPIFSGAMQLGGATHLVFHFDRVIAATDIRYDVEVSADLQTWYSGDNYTNVMNEADNPDGVTRAVSVVSLDPTNRFGRLRVSRD